MTNIFHLLNVLNKTEEPETLEDLEEFGTLWVGAIEENCFVLRLAWILFDKEHNLFIEPLDYSKCKTDSELLETVKLFSSREIDPNIFVIIMRSSQEDFFTEKSFVSFIKLVGMSYLSLFNGTSEEREEVLELCRLKQQTQKQKEK